MSSPTIGSEPPAESVWNQPAEICEACGARRPLGTERHSITVSCPDLRECSEADGGFYWVCHECHLMMHEWMDNHPEVQNPAKEAFHRIFKDLAAIIEPRTYRRNTGDTSAGTDPDKEEP